MSGLERLRRLAAILATTVGAAAVWTFVYGRFGYSGADEGFILGLSYRLTLGQLPYADFIYIRPPGSVLLHALPMLLLPDRLVMIVERGLFYLSMAVSSWVSTEVLVRHFDLARLRLDRYLLSMLFFVASVQAFPPQPWHTVDGILFGAISIYLVTCRPSTAGLLAGSFFLFLAMACKQSFYFLAPACVGYVLVVHGWRKAGVLLAGLASWSAAFAATLGWLGLLREFLSQTTSQTGPGSLRNPGFLAYLRGWPVLGAVGIVAAAQWAIQRWSGRKLALAAWPYLLVLGLYGASMYKTWFAGHFVAPAVNYPAVLFVIAAIAVSVDLLRSRRAWPLALMLVLSWCASLSWGYQTPQLYSAPFVFALIYYAARSCGTDPRVLTYFALALALLAQFVGYQFPYREAPRAQLNREMGGVFDRLSYIRTSAENLSRYDELRGFHEKYGGPFTVLPSMPLAAFLTATHPPLSVDWAMNSESAYRTERLIEQLETAEPYVFLEQRPGFVVTSGQNGSRLYLHVQDNWRRVESGAFLDVYRYDPPVDQHAPDRPGPGASEPVRKR